MVLTRNAKLIVFFFHQWTDVADSYIKISGGLIGMATIEQTDLDKWVLCLIRNQFCISLCILYSHNGSIYFVYSWLIHLFQTFIMNRNEFPIFLWLRYFV